MATNLNEVESAIVEDESTSEAMAAEKACKQYGAPGRLIPVPRLISSGCGLSWCAELSERELLLEVMAKVGLKEEELHECMV